VCSWKATPAQLVKPFSAVTFVVASGCAVYTLLPEGSAWNKTSFSTVYSVAAAPGVAIAAVAPQISVSTAAVP